IEIDGDGDRERRVRLSGRLPSFDRDATIQVRPEREVCRPRHRADAGDQRDAIAHVTRELPPAYLVVPALREVDRYDRHLPGLVPEVDRVRALQAAKKQRRGDQRYERERHRPTTSALAGLSLRRPAAKSGSSFSAPTRSARDARSAGT